MSVHPLLLLPLLLVTIDEIHVHEEWSGLGTPREIDYVVSGRDAGFEALEASIGSAPVRRDDAFRMLADAKWLRAHASEGYEASRPMARQAPACSDKARQIFADRFTRRRGAAARRLDRRGRAALPFQRCHDCAEQTFRNHAGVRPHGRSVRRLSAPPGLSAQRRRRRAHPGRHAVGAATAGRCAHRGARAMQWSADVSSAVVGRPVRRPNRRSGGTPDRCGRGRPRSRFLHTLPPCSPSSS